MKYTSKTPVEIMKKRSEFVALNKRDNAIFRRGFVFQYEKNDSGKVKVGFTASKKVGNAIARVRAKRRMRALVDACMRLNPDFECSGASFVLIARKSILDCDFTKMEKDLKTALEEFSGK